MEEYTMRAIVIMMLVLALGACTPDEAIKNNIDQKKAIMACDSVINDFQSSLKTELMKAMAAGGPENAISVCNTKAPAIAASYSSEDGLLIKRVSLKPRNPGNAPDEFEAIVLKTFGQTQSSEPQTYSELMTAPDGVVRLRYMKEIKTGDLCLNCHGDPGRFSEGLKSSLTSLYPEDKAIGYTAGDSRGAFSLTLTYPQANKIINKLLSQHNQ